MVSDHPALLNQTQRNDILRLLDEHNQKGPGNIALLIISELPPSTSIEKYAFAKALERAPALDAYAKSNQILVVISLKDRIIRIETSPDISVLVPDDFCKGVIDEVMVPKFRQAQYFEGIREGIVSLIDRLQQTGPNLSLKQHVVTPEPGHVEVMLSGSRGAGLDSGALARFLPVLRGPGFLDSSSLSTADPLAPCALLSAVSASAHVNLVFCGLGNPGCFDLRVPKGTNILGRYDAELARANGGVPRDDPSKAADIVGRIVVWRSWGWSSQLNTLLPPLKQRQCLEMLVEPARLKQALSKLPPAPVMSHAAPASAYITSVPRNLGNEWLAALPKPEMLGMSSVPTGNPLMPCELLSAFRMAARVNEAWGHLPAGKLDTDGRPELTPYAEALKKPLGTGSVDEATAELLAAAIAAEIVRSNWLSAQLLDKATQGECLAEMFQPGGLRTKLQRAGVTLPPR